MFRTVLCAAAAIALVASPAAAEEEAMVRLQPRADVATTTTTEAEEAGVVRLGDLSTRTPVQQVRAQSPCDGPSCEAPACAAPSCGVPGSCVDSCDGDGRCGFLAGGRCRNGNCPNGCCPHCGHPHSKLGDWLCAQSQLCHNRAANAKATMCSYLKCKFGYFCPSANCGAGVGLSTKYGMVYALDPSYADPRDADRYAAQGYNMHVNVPLAPNVRHSYNYSWGIPSSRLTPVRHGSVVGPAQPAHAHP